MNGVAGKGLEHIATKKKKIPKGRNLRQDRPHLEELHRTEDEFSEEFFTLLIGGQVS